MQKWIEHDKSSSNIGNEKCGAKLTWIEYNDMSNIFWKER